LAGEWREAGKRAPNVPERAVGQGQQSGRGCGMGEFISVSAIWNRTVDEVAAAICAYAASQGVDAGVTHEALDERSDAVVASREGWTVIFWPMHFLGGNETISQALSGSLQTLVSSVD